MQQMGSRTVSLLLMIAFVVGSVTADPRSLAGLDNIVDTEIPCRTKTSLTVNNQQFCQLCEEFASEAIFYLKENETQSEILDTLHHACAKALSFKEECNELVDYYAHLFFTRLASLSAEQFCESVDLCDTSILIRLPTRDDACTRCHQVVEEILANLNDPGMELNIIEILLKGCSNAETFVQQCKKLIIQSAPVIIEEIKKVLETNDLCGKILACPASTVNNGARAAAATA